MNKMIKDIIERNCSKEDKDKALDSLTNDIALAKDILSGKYKYCPKCKDYYHSKSFFTEREVKTTDVCTYSDPINSSGNEYTEKDIEYTYSVCPKGHKELIHSQIV